MFINGWINTMNIYRQWNISHKEEGNSDTWMNLENVMLRGISQTQKDKYCMIPLIGDTQNGQTQRQKIQWWLSGAGRNGGGGDILFNG